MLANRFHAGSDPGVNEEDRRGQTPGGSAGKRTGTDPGEPTGVRPHLIASPRGERSTHAGEPFPRGV